MKKYISTIAGLAVAAAGSAQVIQLPKPSTDDKTTLLEAIAERHSGREYSDKAISDETLSTVLWAACGINRPEEARITAPSALNSQDIMVYVVREDGAYLYQPAGHSLKKVSSKDLRKEVAGGQDFAATAPVSLLLVSDHGKFPAQIPSEARTRMGVMDGGYVSENICLVCAALGLETVPRMTMDTVALKKELALGEEVDLIVNNQIGYPKK